VEVGDWLGSHGLRQYETASRDNGADPEVPPDLTNANLEQLGDVLVIATA
jgi:SAM domain (Sterile alpha motif)